MININNPELHKNPNENERAYIWRIGQLYDADMIYKDNGITKADWYDLCKLFNSQLREDDEEFTEATYRKPYQNAVKYWNDVFKYISPKEQIDELDIKIRNLQKERCKIQTEKLEYNRWLREDARDEMFMERIIEAIKSIDTDCSNIKYISTSHNNIEHGLFLADAHFGKEFKIYGLRNEVLNEYSPEIFYQRMEKVFSETLDYISKEKVTELKVFNLGDSLDGFLRASQIWTLRYGVVESSIIYGKYMAEWLKKLSDYVRVEYLPTFGNHTELRLLDGRKGEHLNENIEDVVNELISVKNENNPNFELIKNKTGLIFTQLAGFNLLGIHGEVKNPLQALKDFSNIYDTKIDLMAMGHKHHGNFINCGYKKQILGIGSIVGSDDFSMYLRKQADATANIISVEFGVGKINDKIIVLN